MAGDELAPVTAIANRILILPETPGTAATPKQPLGHNVKLAPRTYHSQLPFLSSSVTVKACLRVVVCVAVHTTTQTAIPKGLGRATVTVTALLIGFQSLGGQRTPPESPSTASPPCSGVHRLRGRRCQFHSRMTPRARA